MENYSSLLKRDLVARVVFLIKILLNFEMKQRNEIAAFEI